MVIAEVCRGVVPPEKYGGTERDVYWLADALSRLGHKVYLLAWPGSKPRNAELLEIPRSVKTVRELISYLPSDVEIIHFHFKIDIPPPLPFLVTIHGNMRWDEKVPPNTVFQSYDQARRHGSPHFVYNGVDLNDYEVSEDKSDYFLFMAKFLSRKGLDTAVKLARQLKFTLIAAGGWRWSFRRNVKYVGEVGGEKKRGLLSKARALLMPIRWPEPLSLVALESLASGTPVITSRLGSMPEIVSPEVGFLCDTYEEFIEAIKNIDKIDPCSCRRRARDYFSSEIMAGNYLKYFQKVLKDGEIGKEPLVEKY